MTPKVENFSKCGCGRNPGGPCMGWHGLNDEQWAAKRQELNESLGCKAEGGCTSYAMCEATNECQRTRNR